jgi:hypothetical protein
MGNGPLILIAGRPLASGDAAEPPWLTPRYGLTYVSWFLTTVVYFLDKADFRPSPPLKTAPFIEMEPAAEAKPLRVIIGPPGSSVAPLKAPGNPPPQGNPTPRISSSRPASSSASPPNPPNPLNPFAPAAPARPASQPPRPARQSRLWNAGGPAGLAAIEQRDAARRESEPREAQPKQPQHFQHCPLETLEVIVIQMRDE